MLWCPYCKKGNVNEPKKKTLNRLFEPTEDERTLDWRKRIKGALEAKLIVRRRGELCSLSLIISTEGNVSTE
jgi:hypothetical protein